MRKFKVSKTKLMLFHREESAAIIAVFPDGKLAKIESFHSLVYSKWTTPLEEPCYAPKKLTMTIRKNNYPDVVGVFPSPQAAIKAMKDYNSDDLEFIGYI